MVGAVIGNYQLVRKIGEGGMGAVYLGQHRLLGRRAAVKVLLPALSARPDVVDRFFNEARAVTAISDPGIVQVFDFGYHSDGSAYLVMEYLEGETLDRRLARLGRLAVPEALRICRQVATSLAAAHAQQIVHRDLKPENIFLVRDAEVLSGERCKVLDFGVAKLSEQHSGKVKTSLGALMGTPLYMSPEQCRGLPNIDHRSDIYSLGCVLFHLITGGAPFEGEGTGDIISAHIREPAPIPSARVAGIPPEVDALLARVLAKLPADRVQTMVALTAELGAVLARQVPSSEPPALHSLPTTRVSAADMHRWIHGEPGAANQPLVPGNLAEAQTLGGTVYVPLPSPQGIAATTLGTSTGQSIARSRSAVRMSPRIAAGGAALVAIIVMIAIAIRDDASGEAPALPEVASPIVPAMPPPPRQPATHAPPEVQVAKVEQPPSAVDPPPRAPPPKVVEPPPPRVPDPAKRSQGIKKKPPAHDSIPSPVPSPAPVTAAPPKGRPTKCGRSAFAAVYNAPTLTQAAVRDALRSLRTCHDSGDVNEAEFDEIQAALVARL